MEFRSATSRALDREHRDNLALLRRLEAQVLVVPPGGRPAPEFAAIAAAAAERVEDDIARHLQYEEEHLFARLAGGGEHELVEALHAEHESLRASGIALLAQLRNAAGGTTDAPAFASLRPAALDYVQRLAAHVAHETDVLLPTLDLVLDDDVDQEIAYSYAVG